MEEYKGSPALDAGLLAAAQAVEHYEITRYGTLVALGRSLATMRRRNCCRLRLPRRKRPTRRCATWAKVASTSGPSRKPPDSLKSFGQTERAF